MQEVGRETRARTCDISCWYVRRTFFWNIHSQILGTGTILDAWKMGLPIIVVPNTQLLDDHQTEMAKHLSKEGYAIMSSGRYYNPDILISTYSYTK